MKIFAWLYLGGLALLLVVVIVKAIEEIKFRLGGWKPEREKRRSNDHKF